MGKFYVFEGARRFYDADTGVEIKDIDCVDDDFSLVVAPSYSMALEISERLRFCSDIEKVDAYQLFKSSAPRLIIGKGFSEEEKVELVNHLPEHLFDKVKGDRYKDATARMEALAEIHYHEAFDQDNIWICVYMDALGYADEDGDNLANICVPTEWLKEALAAEGETDLCAWYNEYTADNTDYIARKAVADGIILECDRPLLIPAHKIMIAVLDDSYYQENGSYPDDFDGKFPHERYVFDTPEAFIQKWHEIDEGAWYWVFADGEEVCSGAVDPNDIELFEDYFGMSFDKIGVESDHKLSIDDKINDARAQEPIVSAKSTSKPEIER